MKNFVLLFLVFVFVTLFLIKDEVYLFYLKNKYPLKFKEYIVKNSSENDLDPSFVSAVIYEESRFKPYSLSDKGAVGLMQILPKTALYIANRKDDEDFDVNDLSDPEKNIEYGSYYLSYLKQKYDDIDLVLAAYNAGEGNVDKWLLEDKFEVKFEETSNFVNRVKKSQYIYKKLYFSD